MRKTTIRMRSLGALLIPVLLLITVLACTTPPSDPDAGSTENASAELAAVLEEAADHAVDEWPELRLEEGLPVDKLWDKSWNAAERNMTVNRDLLDRLRRIDDKALSDDQLTSRDLLAWHLETTLEGHEYFWLETMITPYSHHAWNLRQLFAGLPFAGPEDAERYLDLLAQVPAFTASLEEHTRGQLERGIAVSRAALPGVLSLIEGQIQPADGGFYRVADKRLGALDDEARADFHRRVATIVEERVNPAWQRLRAFLDREVRAAAPEGVGLVQYPGGEDYYRYRVRHITWDISPEEVHQLGLEMIAELEEKMTEIRREIGFSGGREEFHALLKSDPRFFPKGPEEVKERLESAARAMDERLETLFLVRQKAPWRVERLTPALEATMTYGYYNPPNPSEPAGRYYFNGSGLDQRSWLPLEALAYHELIPGHHYQVARQMENRDLPRLQRMLFFFPLAYVEGWAVYSARLGLEAGLLQDPYHRYGLYSGEAFLASRLVVDTGMNLLGWSLEKARQFMSEHTLESPTQIATETLRYSTDIPGQALGYQMGQRRILELRHRAEEALGERFDVRRFHEVVLRHGPVPMTVLEKRVERFIERELGG